MGNSWGKWVELLCWTNSLLLETSSSSHQVVEAKGNTTLLMRILKSYLWLLTALSYLSWMTSWWPQGYSMSLVRTYLGTSSSPPLMQQRARHGHTCVQRCTSNNYTESVYKLCAEQLQIREDTQRSRCFLLFPLTWLQNLTPFSFRWNARSPWAISIILSKITGSSSFLKMGKTEFMNTNFFTFFCSLHRPITWVNEYTALSMQADNKTNSEIA